jgi:O-methyltransferase involved in polyketide biosynthesis
MAAATSDARFDVERDSAGLHGVSRTLLIPLCARARAAELLPGLAYDDAVAREVVARLALTTADVGRDKFTMRLCIARSAVLQQAMAALVTERGATGDGDVRSVIMLACGLDTLPQRLEALPVRWLCTDLPDVIGLRDRLLPPGPSMEHLPVRLPEGLAALRERVGDARPVFVLEGILPYLERSEVIETLGALGQLAPAGADLLVDGYHPALLAFARFGDGFRRMQVHFRFGIADTRDYARLAPRLRHRRTWDLLARIPPLQRKRCLLPAVAAGRLPLATVAQLELLPT